MDKESSASFKVAQAFVERGDFEQAIAEYEKIEQIDPKNLQICYELINLYARRGLLLKVSEEYLKIADVYLGSKDLDRGLETCNSVIKLEPESIKAREKLIEIYSQMGDNDSIREQCFVLSRICTIHGHSDKALEFLRKGIEVDPDNLDARLELASMNVKQGNIKEGINQYKQVGQAFWEKGELAKASETYKRITVLQPDDTESHLAMGTLYRHLGQLEDAKNAFRFILRYDLTHIKALTELGLVCQEKGEIDSAILAFKKIVDINPLKTMAKEKLGELYEIRGQVQEAVKQYFFAAEDYMKENQKDKSIQMCQIILELDNKHSKAIRMLKDLGYTQPEPEDEAPEEDENTVSKDDLKRGMLRPQSGIMMLPRSDGGAPRPAGPKRTGLRGGILQSATVRLNSRNMPGGGLSPFQNRGPGATKPLTPLKTKLDEDAHRGNYETSASIVDEDELVPEDTISPEMNALNKAEASPEPQEDEEEVSFDAADDDPPTINYSQLAKRESAAIDHRTMPLNKSFITREEDDGNENKKPGFSSPVSQKQNFLRPREEKADLKPRPRLITRRGGATHPLNPSLIGDHSTKTTMESSDELSRQNFEQNFQEEEAPQSIRPERSPSSKEEIKIEKERFLKMERQLGELTQATEEIVKKVNLSSKYATIIPDEEPVKKSFISSGFSSVVSDDKPQELSSSFSTTVSEIDDDKEAALLIFSPDGIFEVEEEAEKPKPEPVSSRPFIKSSSVKQEIPQDAVVEFVPVIEYESTYIKPEMSSPPEDAVVEFVGDEFFVSSFEEKEPEVKRTPDILPEPVSEAVPDILPVKPNFDFKVLPGVSNYLKSIEANPRDITSRNKLACVLMDNGLLVEAAEEYEQILKVDNNANVYSKIIEIYNFLGDEDKLRANYLSLGNLYKNNSKHDAAIDVYQHLLLLDTDDFLAREGIADILLLQEKRKEAISQYISVANIYSSKGLIKEVVDIYQKILKLEPQGILIHTKLAETYGQLGMTDKAIQEYLLIAEMYLDKKLWNNAIEIYERIVNLSPEHMDAHLKLSQLYMKNGMSSKAIEQDLLIADIYINRGRFNEAIEMSQNIIGTEPEHIGAREKIIQIYLKTGYSDKAIAECNSLVDILLKRDDIDKTISIYENILKIDMKNYDIHYKLAELYEKKGFINKAIQEYMAMADIFVHDNNYDQAISVYRRCLTLDVNNIEVRYLMAVLLADRKADFEASVNEFEFIITLNPNHKDALERLSDIYMKLGKVQEAIKISQGSNKDIFNQILEQHKKAIEKNPDDFEVRYNLGLLYKESGDLQNAVEQFQSLLKCPEKLLSAYNMLGLCFNQMGMGNLAINQLKKGLSIEGYKNQEYLELKYNLGLLYEKRGMAKEALSIYEEVLGVDIKYADTAQRVQQLEEQLKSL